MSEHNNSSIDSQWQRRYEREVLKRKEAEKLLESKSLELYTFNRELEDRINAATEELRQNNEEMKAMLDYVSEQNVIISRSMNSIQQSIETAKRIQNSVLPSKEYISRLFPNAFTLFLPKDGVSGDFYWVGTVDHRKIFVVADCTGHGVPGAMMSFIGTFLLNKIVLDQKVFMPSHILFYLHSAMTQYFSLNSEEIHEGMDMAICMYNPENKTLRYSGANIPLYYIKNKELIEIKPDKKSIGGHQLKRKSDSSFECHEILIDEKIQTFMSSDGYKDQFGGLENKKFMAKRLKELLLLNAELSPSELKIKLQNTFESHKGSYPQTDDVLISGITFHP